MLYLGGQALDFADREIYQGDQSMNISRDVRFQLLEKIDRAKSFNPHLLHLRKDRLEIFNSRGQVCETLNIVRGFLGNRLVRSVFATMRSFADVLEPFQ